MNKQLKKDIKEILVGTALVGVNMAKAPLVLTGIAEPKPTKLPKKMWDWTKK